MKPILWGAGLFMALILAGSVLADYSLSVASMEIPTVEDTAAIQVKIASAIANKNYINISAEEYPRAVFHLRDSSQTNSIAGDRLFKPGVLVELTVKKRDALLLSKQMVVSLINAYGCKLPDGTVVVDASYVLKKMHMAERSMQKLIDFLIALPILFFLGLGFYFSYGYFFVNQKSRNV
jgi:hypothetical protein